MHHNSPKKEWQWKAVSFPTPKTQLQSEIGKFCSRYYSFSKLPWLWKFKKQLWLREIQRKTQHLRHNTRDVLWQSPKRHLPPSPSPSCSGQWPEPSYRVAASGRGLSSTRMGLRVSFVVWTSAAGGWGGTESWVSELLERIKALDTSNLKAMRVKGGTDALKSCRYRSQEFTKARSVRYQSTAWGQQLGAEAVRGIA